MTVEGHDRGTMMPPAAEGGPEGLARTAAGAFGWSFLNTALSRLGTMVVGIALARLLGPDEFATFAVAMVMLLLVLSFNELGVSLAIVRWERRPESIFGTVNSLSTGGSVLLCLAMVVTAPAVARLLGAPEATGIIRLMALTVVFSGIVAGPVALLQRHFRQRRRLVIDQIVTWSGTAVSLGLALGGVGAWSLAWGRLVGTAVGVVLFVHATRPYRWQFDPTVVGPLLRFGMPLAGASIVVFAVSYVEQIAVAVTLGATALGYFVLAFNLASWPVNMFSQPLRSVAPAVFSRLQSDPERMRGSFTTLLRAMAAVVLPVCLVAAVAAEDIVRFVYGEAWTPAAPVFRVLVLIAALRIFFELSYDFLLVHRTGQLFTVQLVWLAILTPAVIVAARRQGLVGVAVAELLVALLVVLPLYLGMLRRTGLRLALLGPAVLTPLAVASAAAGVALIAGRLLASPFASSVVAGVLVLVAVSVVAGLRRDELRQLRRLRQSAPDPAPAA